MNFSDALQLLKEGKQVARTGWNSNLWLILINHGCPSQNFAAGSVDLGEHGAHALTSYVGLKLTQGGFCPWTPTQIDMLEEDWKVI